MNPLLLNVEQMTEMVLRFYWPLVRVAGVLSVAPVIGSPQIPKRIRVSLALVLTVAMLPLTGPIPAIDPMSLAGISVTLNQFIIGLVMGFTLLIVFNVLAVAGESLSAAMGLGFALMSDPSSGFQVPIISQFFTILASLLFLALDGHHALINLLASSFTLVPISDTLRPDGFWQLVEWSSVLFSGALMLALPALVTMLCINLIMGVMTRAAPQLNIFSVGFPITMTLGFLVIMVTLPGFAPGFEKLLTDGFASATSFIQNLVPL